MHILTNIHENFRQSQHLLKVNTTCGATLGLIGIAPLELSIDDHNFVV